MGLYLLQLSSKCTLLTFQKQSKIFMYVDDIALAYQHKDLRATEETLTSDLAALEKYFRTYKLNPTLQKPKCPVSI